VTRIRLVVTGDVEEAALARSLSSGGSWPEHTQDKSKKYKWR
jgi:hypothetical protein